MNELGTSFPLGEKIEFSSERAAVTNTLAAISHEVRTPLHAILGLTELLQDEAMSDRARRHVEKIKLASEALMQTLNTSIDAARAGKDHLFLDESKFELQKTVESATRMFALNAEAKGVALNLNFDPRLLSKNFIGDEGRVLQILSNLLGNAVKFTDKGFITFWVALKRNSGLEQEIFFSIEDSGVGIPENFIDKITEQYVQVETSQKGRPKGSGLGLYITNKIIRLLGSKLTVSSNSSGSRFSFSLRLQSIDDDSGTRYSISDGSIIRVVAEPSSNIEVLRHQLIGLGANVEAHTQLTVDLLKHRRTLTFVDYKVAKEQPELWQKLQYRCADNSLVLLCSEFELDESESLLGRARSWFSPHLPSELVGYCDAVGAITGMGSRSQRFAGSVQETLFDPTVFSVLCVDDSHTNLIVLCGVLTKLGYTNIVQAVNGQHAVEMVELHKPDIVLMDYHMPIINGAQAVKKLRLLGYTMPVIGLTALSEQDLNETGDSKHFDSILTKPASATKISDKMKQYLQPTQVQNSVTGVVK